ncbi:MAG TPA: class I mannose-6-phosphate isomerase [Sandaracinaceae bacterium LLY-WYZ-13_1]|nr:class I mannose-6-phosphate isomerase [Sandaracinaceae bacterium LLY-WYZ-13_1]
MEHQENDAPRPVPLAADNFTPPSRTPWGGRRIPALKGLAGDAVVGESWELSVEPSFPSRTADGRRLDDLVAATPEAWLGDERARGGTALLVKLLDAADELSVQIHPGDDHPGLGPDESGKPESWYVVDHDEGAGIYLGLAERADRATMERALDAGEDVSALLPFVPVEPGDFFLIEAGTPHCIGRGVLLVEPQRVLPGRRGVTYRYWDWNRRYDARGRRDPSGEPRPLHRDAALDVTDWRLPRGDALLSRVRHRAGPPMVDGDARLEGLAGPDGALRSEALAVARLSGTGTLRPPAWGVLRGLTVLSGTVRLGDLALGPGRSAAIPARWHGPLTLDRGHAILAATPA